MEKLSVLRALMREYRGRPGHRRHVSLVVDVGGARTLLREVFFDKLPKGVEVTDDADELFRIDGTAVRLRVETPYGAAFIVQDSKLPSRSCCDATAMATMLVSMGKGVS